MRLTIVGSGAASSTVGCNACSAVDNRLLVDCGAPAHLLLPRVGIDAADIDTVLLTHFHADHCFMLPMLLGARVFGVEQPRPLRLAGPPGLREYVLRLLRTGYGQELEELMTQRLGLETLILQDGTEVVAGGYLVRAWSVVHSTGPSLAYSVTDEQGVTAAFSGDTTACAGLDRAIAGADVAVVECTGWDGPIDGHLWRGELEVLTGRHPSTRFVLSHLARRGTIAGAITAHDLLQLDIQPRG